jgi:PAS domain-containing protein
LPGTVSVNNVPEAKPTILYIGRESDFVQRLTPIVNANGVTYEVESCPDLKQGLRLLEKKNYSSVVLDGQLLSEETPEKDQYLSSFTRALPVIVLLEPSQKHVGDRLLASGVFDYIVRGPGDLTSLPFVLKQTKHFVPQKREPKERTGVPPSEEGTAFFEVNESSRFLSFDENLSRLLGIPAEDLKRAYLLDFLSDEDREKFYLWREREAPKGESFVLQTQIVLRDRGYLPVDLQLMPYQRSDILFSGFRGYLRVRKEPPAAGTLPIVQEEVVYGADIFREFYALTRFLAQDLVQLFLMKLAELPKRHMDFRHSALFLFDPIKGRYVKELSIGAEPGREGHPGLMDSVSPQTVQKLFGEKEFAVLVRQSVLSAEERLRVHGSPEKGLLEPVEWQPGVPWQSSWRLFIQLKNSKNETLGFVALSSPEKDTVPGKQILQLAEMYGIFASSLMELHRKHERLEAKYKQFKQIFTILETYSINLPIENLIREIVWTIKFSLGFNLVIISILSKSTRRLKIKAVAVESKEKAQILSRLHFAIEEIEPFLQSRYRISHSYMVNVRGSALQLIKRIYGLPLQGKRDPRLWGYDDLLFVPIIIRSHKIVGFVLLDDPADRRRPDLETIQILEKIANLLAVTIENKLIYTNLKRKCEQLELQNARNSNSSSPNRIKQIFRKINLSL